MRTLLLLLVAGACAGPGQARLAETPTATTKATPTMAPPASDNDKDRAQLVSSMDDMRDAQSAHREAANTPETTPRPLPPPPVPSSGVKPVVQPASPDPHP
ncbi:MAG: hypothetical protein H0T46_22295 [Deltaproteobacteria bacterium]|nr:hypothetical protein [Deltaproteobacteria bacterium]